MRAALSVLLLLGLCTDVDASIADTCEKDTGGTCKYSGCIAWRNASCNKDSQCVCGKDTCARDGRCIDPSKKEMDCPKDTGGTCSFQGCLPFRNATCKQTHLWALGFIRYSSCECEKGFCALNGVCRNVSDPLWLQNLRSRNRDERLLAGSCEIDTENKCGTSWTGKTDCPSWSGAKCIDGKCLCNKSTDCALPLKNRQGACIDGTDWHLRENKPEPPPAEDKIALILSGGGAKGAYEVGVLQGLCERFTGKHSSSAKAWVAKWTKIFGISIGALNAAGMAQFPYDMQCTEAVQFLQKFWGSIKDSEDVFIAATGSGRTACLSSELTVWAQNGKNFHETGGLCNAQPGGVAFQAAVKKEDIQNSGMQLRVAATNMNTGQATWWNESSPDIIWGAMASGRLAPLLPPMIDGAHIFIDGGFISNTPIMKAISEGAKKIMVIYLASLEGVGIPPSELDQDLGVPTLMFITNLIQARMGNEITVACHEHPDVEILAHIPEETPGVLTDFTKKGIKNMMQKGYDAAKSKDPVDLCVKFGMKPKHSEICGSEGETCDCDGTVYFGRKFLRGKPGTGATTTIKSLTQTDFVKANKTGPFTCWIGEFNFNEGNGDSHELEYNPWGKGEDPLPGYYKWCLCKTERHKKKKDESPPELEFDALSGALKKPRGGDADFYAPEAQERRARTAAEMLSAPPQTTGEQIMMTSQWVWSAFEKAYDGVCKQGPIRDIAVFAAAVMTTHLATRLWRLKSGKPLMG